MYHIIQWIFFPPSRSFAMIRFSIILLILILNIPNTTCVAMVNMFRNTLFVPKLICIPFLVFIGASARHHKFIHRDKVSFSFLLHFCFGKKRTHTIERGNKKKRTSKIHRRFSLSNSPFRVSIGKVENH